MTASSLDDSVEGSVRRAPADEVEHTPAATDVVAATDEDLDDVDDEADEADEADDDDGDEDDDEDDEGDEDEDDEEDDDEDDDEDEDGDEDGEDGDADGEDGDASGSGDDDLFRQSEIAADYVEGLLDVLDMDGDIDELIANGRPVVEVVGGRLQSLVGSRGATLEALQDLTRLAVFRRTGSPSRLLLDIGGYRATRRNELGAVARNAIERVREHGEPVRLEPMSAFERKCVHDVVNATEGVVSESQGEEPNRRIMVRPE